MTRLRLVTLPPADVRARICGLEIDGLLRVAAAVGSDAIPVSVLQPIVDRMLDRESTTAGTGTRLGGHGRRCPQKEPE
jgi:hypothetical protein